MPRVKRLLHRVHAAIYDTVTRSAEHRLLGAMRERLLGRVSGRVLELGAGTGANFPYYPAGARVIATEPDPFMLQRARERASSQRSRILLCQAAAEALPFADDTFDHVAVTLALCTVSDPALSIDESRRVLRAGGRLHLIEHVRADGWLGRAHDLVTPVWRQLAIGCHPNRNTAAALRASGFDTAQLQTQPTPLAPLLYGEARLSGTIHSDA